MMKYVYEEGNVRAFIAERHPFKGVENTSLIPSSINILLRLMRIHTQKNPTLATNLIQSQKKKGVSGK